MARIQLFHRLDFDKNPPADDKVCSISAIQLHPLELDRDFYFAAMFDSSDLEFT